MAHPSFPTVAELLKPITWFPLMWAFTCGITAASQSLGSNLWLITLGLVLTGPLMCASSQAVNDRLDRHVDAINEPLRPIPTGRMPGRWGLYIAVIWMVLSLVWAWGFWACCLGLLLAWTYSELPLRLKEKALMMSAFGVPLNLSGMMVSAWALHFNPQLSA